MELNNIEDCHINLYKSGIVVITRQSYNRNYDEEQNHVKSKTVRKFTISRNKVRSAAIALWQQKKSKNAIFFTITIPFPIEEIKVADCWQRFLLNFRLNYPGTPYVWVKERQKNGNVHYHMIAGRNRLNGSVRTKQDSNFTGFLEINKTWNNIIYNVTGRKPVNLCSVRKGNRPVITSINRVARYLSKYIAKGIEQFNGRAWGCSSYLVLSRLICPGLLSELGEKYGLKLLVNEPFCRVYVVINYFDYG